MVLKTTSFLQDYEIGRAIADDIAKRKDYGFLLDVIRTNFRPEEIFSDDELAEWAEWRADRAAAEAARDAASAEAETNSPPPVPGNARNGEQDDHNRIE